MALCFLFIGCARPVPTVQNECRIEIETTEGQVIQEGDSLIQHAQYLVHLELPDSIGQNFVVAATGSATVELVPSDSRDNYKLQIGTSSKVKVLVFGRHNIGRDPICEREHIIKGN